MADLISRAALLRSLNDHAPKPTTDELYEVNMCIINAPTIDAVPVEWLDKMAEQNQSGVFNAYWFVLKTWQKEQEAR